MWIVNHLVHGWFTTHIRTYGEVSHSFSDSPCCSKQWHARACPFIHLWKSWHSMEILSLPNKPNRIESGTLEFEAVIFSQCSNNNSWIFWCKRKILDCSLEVLPIHPETSSLLVVLPRSWPNTIINRSRQARVLARRLAWRSLINSIFITSGDLESSNLLALLSSRSCPDTIVNGRRQQARAVSIKRFALNRSDSIIIVEINDNASSFLCHHKCSHQVQRFQAHSQSKNQTTCASGMCRHLLSTCKAYILCVVSESSTCSWMVNSSQWNTN